jgi:hypothetical protein
VEAPDVPVRQQSYGLLAELTVCGLISYNYKLNYKRHKYFLLLLSGPMLKFSKDFVNSGDEG